MKFRRHHNNKGYRQIKNGKCAKSLKIIAKKLKIRYGNNQVLIIEDGLDGKRLAR